MASPVRSSLPLASCSPAISSTTPAKPMANPATRRRVSCSPGIRKWLIGSTSSGTTAMVIPAKLEVTYCCPQASRLKGMALVNIPMPKQCSQTRLSVRVAKAGRPSPAISAMPRSSAAASAILPVATQMGARLSRASSTPRNAPPHTTPRRASSPQSRAAGGWRWPDIR